MDNVTRNGIKNIIEILTEQYQNVYSIMDDEESKRESIDCKLKQYGSKGNEIKEEHFTIYGLSPYEMASFESALESIGDAIDTLCELIGEDY